MKKKLSLLQTKNVTNERLLQEKFYTTVKQVWVNENNKNNSYLYKKSNQEVIDREVWASDYVNKNTTIRVPVIKERHENEVLMEYIEVNDHVIENNEKENLIDLLSSIHSLPTKDIPHAFTRRFQPIQKKIEEMMDKEETIKKVLARFQDEQLYADILAMYEQNKLSIQENDVFSHGDFHKQNVLKTNEGYVVIDWEAVCLSSCYSDLFTLLDMTSPLFSNAITKEEREYYLKKYYEKSKKNNLSFSEFLLEYYCFSLVHSVEFLLFAESDKKNGHYPEHITTKQQYNTYLIMKEAADIIRLTKK